MTMYKTLSTAGLFLAVAGVALATPTLKLHSGGVAADGTSKIVVEGVVPAGDSIAGATVVFQYDPALVAVPAAGDIALGTPGGANGTATTDWSITGNNFSNPDGPGTFRLILSNLSNDGQTVSGPIATITMHRTAGSPNLHGTALSLLGGPGKSDLTDINGTAIPLATTQNAVVIPGQYKSLGASITGAPSVGLGGTNIAVVVDNKLRLVKTTDLSDVAPGVTLGGGINGRPAFGTIGNTNVVAVGDQTGNVTVVNATDGTMVGTPATVGTAAGTPAIDSLTGNMYVAANQSGTGPALVKIPSGGAPATPVTITGSTIKLDPAFFGGRVAVGTDTTLKLFLDTGAGPLVPGAEVSDNFIASPILRGDGMGLVAGAAGGGTIYQVNFLTGNVAPQSVSGLPNGSLPLSEGWYDSTADTVTYGAASGSLLNFKFGTTGPVSAGATAGFLTNPISAMPLVIGTTTYAIDNTGNFKSSAGGAVPFGAPASKALAATGRTGSIVVATTDGGVAVMPF